MLLTLSGYLSLLHLVDVLVSIWLQLRLFQVNFCLHMNVHMCSENPMTLRVKWKETKFHNFGGRLCVNPVHLDGFRNWSFEAFPYKSKRYAVVCSCLGHLEGEG